MSFGGNFRDVEDSQSLAVSLLGRRIFTAAVFEGNDLLSQGMLTDIGGHLDVLEKGLSHADLIVIDKHQDFVEDNMIAFFVGDAIGFNDVSLGNLELSTPNSDHSVHNNLLQNAVKNQVELKTISAGIIL